MSAATMFIRTPAEYFLLRVVLGAAQTGNLLSYWFPISHRARMNAVFFVAAPVAAITGNLAAGTIIQFAYGWVGFHGWQWLFVIEGLPATCPGIVAYFYADNRPSDH